MRFRVKVFLEEFKSVHARLFLSRDLRHVKHIRYYQKDNQNSNLSYDVDYNDVGLVPKLEECIKM